MNLLRKAVRLVANVIAPPASLTLEAGYRRFEDLIAQLKSDGHAKLAEKLHYMMHEVAWTTGREFIREFGEAVEDIESTTPSMTPELRCSISQCLDFVRQCSR